LKLILFKELSPRWRVYVEIPRPSRVELKCKPKVLSLPGRVSVELPRPSALGKKLMHFPFVIIIWDTKVF
jgi:hypothetical protein